MWENFLISERVKRNVYKGHYCRSYFWRTTTQQEIDYIEDFAGEIHAFEFKWANNKRVHFSNKFMDAYQTKPQIIDRKNFRDFLEL